MIHHSMIITKGAVDNLNRNQRWPLLIQWNILSTHDEDNFVMMFGGLHIEMASVMVHGNLLAGTSYAFLEASDDRQSSCSQDNCQCIIFSNKRGLSTIHCYTASKRLSINHSIENNQPLLIKSSTKVYSK